MVPTRRQLLSASAALLASLAGCGEDLPDRTPTPTEPAAPDPSHSVATDPPMVTLRRPGDRDPIVTVPDPDERVGRPERANRRAVDRGFVTTREAASWLRIEDIEGADAARQFLAETDFETSYVFVDRAVVPQCFRHLLCHVAWSGSRLNRAYAEVYRDYDVECTTDARDRIAWFLRLDGSIDPLRVEDGATHTQFGSCPLPPGKRGERPDECDERPGNGTTPPDGTPTDGGTTDPTTPTADEPTDANLRSWRWKR